MFAERCLQFNIQFGVRGEAHKQLIQLHDQIESLKSKKTSLESKIKNMNCDIKYFESIETERESIKESIFYLESKKNKLKNENIQLKCSANQLKAQMQALEDLPKSGPQFLKLKHQLENIKVSEISSAGKQFQKNIELQNHFKINDQTLETPRQPVFPTEKRFEINEKNNNEMKAEKNDKKSSEEPKNPNQNYWEKYAKRRRLVVKQNYKE